MSLWGDALRGAKGLLGGIQRGFGTLYGGPDDPRLSPEQNWQAKRQAMVLGGLKGLAAGQQWNGPQGIGGVAEGAAFGQELASKQRAGMVQTGMQQQQILALAQQLGLPPQVVATLEPAQIGKLLEQQREKEQPQIVPAGATLVQNGKPQYQAPFAPEKFGDDVRAAAGALGVTDLNAATPAQWSAIWNKLAELKKLGGSNVNVHLPANVMKEGMTESAVKRYDEMTANGMAAMDLNANFDMMEALIREGGDNITGLAQNLTLPMRELAMSLGLKYDDKVPLQTTIKGIANKLALGNRKEMPGPLSNADIKFLTQIVPNMRNTVQANLMLIKAGRAIGEWRLAMVREFESFVQAHPDGVGWMSHLDEWARRTRPNLQAIAFGDFQ